jgi:ribose 5-phosphate isomerase B
LQGSQVQHFQLFDPVHKRTETVVKAAEGKTSKSVEPIGEVMRIGMAADHGGFALKAQLTAALKAAGHEVVDFGAHELVVGDDYPDFVVPLARAVATGEVTRGVAICGSGVGACVVANKVPGVRAALITESFSAHQGVQDDDMNVMCLGGQVTGEALSWDLVETFLGAQFQGSERFMRRLAKVAALERETKSG